MDSTSNSNSIELIAPDDWHIHLRDGDALRVTVPHAARQFARAMARGLRRDLPGAGSAGGLDAGLRLGREIG